MNCIDFNFMRHGLLLAILCSGNLMAQDPGPINTERPGFTSSPRTMVAGYWQIEAGYQFTRYGTDSSDHTLPNTLLRYGLADNLELQFNWGGHTWARNFGDHFSGFQDSSLAIKWQLTETGSKLEMGFYGSVTLPTGSREFTGDDYDPTAGLYWTYAGKLSWFGAALVSESGGALTSENAIGLSFSLGRKTGAFIEYLGTFNEGQGPGHEALWGITWALAENLQLDINGGMGLNTRVADYFLGAGIGYRF